MRFDSDFEDEVLAQCLVDANYLKTASRVIGAHIFPAKERAWLCRAILETWKEHKCTLTPKLALARIKREITDKDADKEKTKQLPYIQLTHRLYKLRPTSPRATLDELQRFVRFVALQAAIERAADDMEKGDVDKAIEPIRAALLRDIRPAGYRITKWMEEFDDRLAYQKHRKENPDEYIRIPTGIKPLDDVIGGIQESEVGIVMGTTGRGKSIMLTHLGYQAIIRGYNVLHFSLEMPDRQVAMRYDSRFTGQLYKQFKDYDFNEVQLKEMEARLKKMRARLENKLRIVSVPVRKADIVVVRNVIDEQEAEGFKPHMVIVDSGDHLKSLISYDGNLRLQQAEVYWDLKALSDEGYAIWSSTQAGKEWAEKTATAEATSESYDKARIADIVVTLNQPTKRTRATTIVEDGDEEDKKGAAPEPTLSVASQMELFLAKYRDGDSKLRIPLEAEFARMLIKAAGEEPAKA